MNFQELLASWPAETVAFLDNAQAAVVGLINTQKQLVYANAGLRTLLGAGDGHTPDLDYLIVPLWDRLFSADSAKKMTYEGWLTFEGARLPSRSIWGRVWCDGDRALMLGAYDVDELNRTNHDLFAANNQITNLQRELALKNTTLQDTLTELRETQSMLIHSEKMNSLGQLAAGIAHEINNPLAYILSNLESLQLATADLSTAYLALEQTIQQQGTAAQQAQAADIRQQGDLDFVLADFDDLLSATLNGVQRVQQLVGDLGQFSRLDKAACSPINIEENLTSTLAIAQPYLRDKVAVHLELEPLPMIQGYPAELNQAFLNIIINAAQAIEETGQLTIQGYQDGDQVVVQFADTGKGMDPDTLGRVFDPFFTTKPVGTGTGLGLTIAYRIITQMHQGTLSVSSVPNESTTFTIALPLGENP